MQLLIIAAWGFVGLVWAVIVIVTMISILVGKRPRNLNRFAWVIIVLLLPFIGVLFFWVFAR